MEKNSVSLTILKTALIVIVAFCLISSLVSIFSLYSFKQMVDTNIRASGIGEMVGDTERESFSELAEQTIKIWYISFSFIAVAGLYFIKLFVKNEKAVKIINLIVPVVCSVLLIIPLFLCIPVIKQAFEYVNELPKFNSSYPEYKNYYHYVYFQSYQGAALSCFVPLTIAYILLGITSVVTFILSAVKFYKDVPSQRQVTAEEKTNTEFND